MIWLWAAGQHEVAIRAFVRQWLKGSLPDRFVQVTPLGILWAMFWLFVAYAGGSMAFFWILGGLPWYFLALDALVENLNLPNELHKLEADSNVILATRAEYVGGHPQLPHGRFVYLTLGGTQTDPVLSILLPRRLAEPEVYTIPVLDVEKTKEEKGLGESLAQTTLASLADKAPRLFGKEQVTLQVRYSAEGGRKHMVELTNFRHGADEVRNWRNYLVCAQAQADTGVTPHGPWKNLKAAPTVQSTSLAGTIKLEAPHGPSRNGREAESPSSAFTRR